ncbi:MAG: hypothetical protein M3O66_02650 [Verrucomicrobiota bacterium]|nr:hypothetical protein [Verrucomicrobiota bacterium]
MNTQSNPHESTYGLLVRSDEKGRSAIELIVYALLIWSAVFSIWQFAQQPITLPTSRLAVLRT